jgi:uncharacterized membrane protein YraQ (UPF0718 family)
MKKSLIGLAIATLILVLFAYFFGGTELVLAGLERAFGNTKKAALLILASFLLIGQLLCIVDENMIARTLKSIKGLKGIVMSALVGGLFPVGPYLFFPFVKMFHGYDLPYYILIAFIFGKHTYDFARIPMEISLISLRIALIRYLTTLPIPIIAALITYRLFRNRTLAQINHQNTDSEVV